MSERAKIVASALVSAALTAALFLTFGAGPPPDSNPPANPGIAAAPSERPTPIRGAPTEPPVFAAEPPVVAGDGAITGRVLDGAGVGVAGVVIIAAPVPERSGRSEGQVPPVPDLDEEIRKAVAATRRRVTGTRRATTNEKGEYRVSGLGDVGYYLHAWADGYTIRTARGSTYYDVKPGSEVHFTAKAVARVRVVVEGIDERIAGRIRVLRADDLESLARAGGMWWSPERPVLVLSPGTHWLRAVQGDHKEKMSDPQEVTLEGGPSVPRVVLRLLEHPGLRGRIVPKDDIDPVRVDVWALRFAGEKPPPLNALRPNPSALRGRYDRRDQSFSFPDIRPGRYLVWATLGGHRAMGSEVVRIVDRMVDLDLDVGILDRERYVTVCVLGPDGKPLEPRGLSISTSYRGPGMTVGGGGEAIRRVDGSWLVCQMSQVPSPDKTAGGAYRISVNHHRLGRREKSYDPRSRETIVFRFGKPSNVTVTLTGFEAAGLDHEVGLSLMAQMPTNSIHGSATTAEAGDGVFLLQNVQPGSWFVVLTCGVIVDRKAITVEEGENRITWAVPPLHTLRVTTGAKGRYGTFGLRRLDPAGNWMKQFASPREGRDAIYPFVPAGRYELEGSFDGKMKTVTIDVPAQTHVTLD